MEQKLELAGTEIKLTNSFDTDDLERENWRTRQEIGKGFIRDEQGELQGRLVANIPTEEAAMLRTLKDIDLMLFEELNDKNALRRLLGRYPHWKVCDGGV